MTPKTRQRLRIIAAICLVGALVPLLWNRHGGGSKSAPRTHRQTEKPQRPASPAELSAPRDPRPTPKPGPPEVPPRQLAEPPASIPPPDYDAEEFTHVPDWIPRPANAVSARAEDASLRSDGFVEGTLRFTFGADETDALDEITAHLEAAGMSAEAVGAVYSSQDPPRRCEVRVESAPDGGMMVSLIYQGTDHDKGCLCPTCGGSSEQPNQ